MKVRFPDGTVVLVSPLAERQEKNPDRDFALYLDPAWRPTWEAAVVDWPDLGVPASSMVAMGSILATFAAAKRGARIEVGCLGGRGRTGTRCSRVSRSSQAKPCRGQPPRGEAQSVGSPLPGLMRTRFASAVTMPPSVSSVAYRPRIVSQIDACSNVR